MSLMFRISNVNEETHITAMLQQRLESVKLVFSLPRTALAELSFKCVLRISMGDYNHRCRHRQKNNNNCYY